MRLTALSVIISILVNTLTPCFQLFAQQKELPRITLGVIPFGAEGVQRYEAVSLSNRLHSELIKTKQFRVIERERVDAILEEIHFQQTGFCTDQECVINVGNMLGARWMAAGSVGKVGQTYTIDVRIIDVETRQVIHTMTRNYVGIVDGLLNLMKGIATELAFKTSEALKYGSLEIVSNPPDAYIYIDGSLKGRTPKLVQSVPIGERKIVVKKTGYLDWKRDILIEPLKKKDLNAQLTQLCQLSISSIPSHADIYINGRLLGMTPFSKEIPKGKYLVEIKKQNYNSWKRTLDIIQDEKLNINLLQVSSNENKIKKKNTKWIWFIVGTIVAGGTIYFVTQTDDKENEIGSIIIDIPRDL